MTFYTRFINLLKKCDQESEFHFILTCCAGLELELFGCNWSIEYKVDSNFFLDIVVHSRISKHRHHRGSVVHKTRNIYYEHVFHELQS